MLQAMNTGHDGSLTHGARELCAARALASRDDGPDVRRRPPRRPRPRAGRVGDRRRGAHRASARRAPRRVAGRRGRRARRGGGARWSSRSSGSARGSGVRARSCARASCRGWSPRSPNATRTSTRGCSRPASTRGRLSRSGRSRSPGSSSVDDAARARDGGGTLEAAARRARLDRRIADADVNVPRNALVAMGAVAAWFLGGRLAGFAGSIAATLVVLAAPTMVVRRRNRRRERATQERLAEAVSLIASAMRSGRSLHQAIELAATELDPLLGSTFRRLADRTGLGDPMDEAIDGWARDVGRSATPGSSPGCSSSIAGAAGTSPAVSLENLAETLRDRRAPRASSSRSLRRRACRPRSSACSRSGSSVPVGDRPTRARGRATRRRPGGRGDRVGLGLQGSRVTCGSAHLLSGASW